MEILITVHIQLGCHEEYIQYDNISQQGEETSSIHLSYYLFSSAVVTVIGPHQTDAAPFSNRVSQE